MEIELKDIGFKYKTTWVFKDMNLNVSSGEVVAFGIICLDGKMYSIIWGSLMIKM